MITSWILDYAAYSLAKHKQTAYDICNCDTEMP